MPVTNPTRHLSRNASLWNTVRRLQATLDISDPDMAEMCLLSPREFANLRSRQKEFKTHSAMSLADRLDIGFESLITSRLDYKALAQHRAGNRDFLPARYRRVDLSRRRTVLNVLDYIELRFGIERRALLLRKFQMNEAMFADPDAKINFCFSVDLANEVFKYERDESSLIEMGKFAAHTHRHSPIGRVLARSARTADVYETMFGDLMKQFVEENFRWRLLALDARGCRIEGTPNPVLRGGIPQSYIRSRTGCLIREGFIISLPHYIGMPDARVTKLACVCQGDAACGYDVKFPVGVA